MTSDQRYDFETIWRATMDAMYAFMTEVRQHPSSLFPRQHFIREQSSLFVEDLVVKAQANLFTAKRFREGVENLYYLLKAVQGIDPLASRTLCDDIINIINMTGVLVEFYEQSEGLKETCWYSVAEFFKTIRSGFSEHHAVPLGQYNNFRLGGLLGAGGFGVVCKAWLGNIKCVLKFVPPQMLPTAKHALADKQVASMINHPCLVKYYATFMTTGAFVTCMEYIRGVDLTQILKATKTGLPSTVVRTVIAQLGLAIQHLHFKGFIHRDVKPDNIMVLPGCKIKLIDFDTCKVAIGKYSTKYMPTFQEKTQGEFSSKEMAGTIMYMPPEAYKMTGLGRSMDWWAVGVITYELSTGRTPFCGATEFEVRPQIIHVSYSWPKGNWSSKLKKFVADCLNPDTSTRLCSRHYLDFQRHPYFKGIDFEHLESVLKPLHYSLIDKLLSQMPAHQPDAPGQVSPSAPGLVERGTRLFPNMDFRDLDSQLNAYCYSSTGFINCMEILKTGKIPSEKDIQEEPEFLVVDDDYSAPYVFENFRRDLVSSETSIDIEPVIKTKKKKKDKAIKGRPEALSKFMSFVPTTAKTAVTSSQEN